jgi:hypothetical protein
MVLDSVALKRLVKDYRWPPLRSRNSSRNAHTNPQGGYQIAPAKYLSTN